MKIAQLLESKKKDIDISLWLTEKTGRGGYAHVSGVSSFKEAKHKLLDWKLPRTIQVELDSADVTLKDAKMIHGGKDADHWVINLEFEDIDHFDGFYGDEE